jgi:xanthine dehydrogenase accessory factor
MRGVVLIRGGNDIASAVAHRLFTSGYRVLILETRRPLTVRRGMAYATAVYDGRMTLAGVTAEHARTLEQAFAFLETGQAIPVVGNDEAGIVAAISPQVLVEARLRKQERSASRIAEAPLVIGLGPGFTAGVEAHLVIETNRGPHLGRVIAQGEAEPYTGEPIEIGGYAKARYLYAASGGMFRTMLDLGSRVARHQVVGDVASTPLIAQIGGTIRGIVRNGLVVSAGAKLVDIDPREPPAPLSELSPKAWAIADAVLTAIRAATPELA